MGYYINPPDQEKEDFLANYKSLESITWEEVPNNCVPVVLVDNYIFTAAGVAYSKRELEVLTQPDDTRPKIFYIVPIVDLCNVVDDFGEMICLMNKTE